MNCRSRVCLSTPVYLFSLSRIFTDLIMHNYRSNQSALMTRCGTDFRHQYGIFGGESQTSVSRNATRPGAKKEGCFRRLKRERNWDDFWEGICLCKFTSSPAKNDRKRTINIAFASWHIQLKNRVSDFWHVHLFVCGTGLKSEGANHQPFLWKSDH